MRNREKDFRTIQFLSMKNGISRLSISLGLVLVSASVFAQSGSSGSNLYTSILMGVIGITVVAILLSLTDNLLLVEAKKTGADKSGRNFSIFPRWNEIFSPKLPDHVKGQSVVRLQKGHDILLEGKAAKQIEDASYVNSFAVQPQNFRGIMPIPKVVVEVGDEVKAGDVLFFDKKNPEVKYVSPVSGEVTAVNRAEKRAIKEIVILADKEMKYKNLDSIDLDSVSREDLVEFLKANGGLPLFKQRPFNIVADPNIVPDNIFVSTFDTAPLACDMGLVIEGKESVFNAGLKVLNKLTKGSVYLGLDGNAKEAPSKAFTEAVGVEKTYFNGPHPAGNVGIQIHHTNPITSNTTVWTLGVQEVLTLGTMVSEGKYDASRVVAIAGKVNTPKHVRTFVGANIEDLLKGQIAEDNLRVISGDVLSGKIKETSEYLHHKFLR